MSDYIYIKYEKYAATLNKKNKTTYNLARRCTSTWAAVSQAQQTWVSLQQLATKSGLRYLVNQHGLMLVPTLFIRCFSTILNYQCQHSLPTIGFILWLLILSNRSILRDLSLYACGVF